VSVESNLIITKDMQSAQQLPTARCTTRKAFARNTDRAVIRMKDSAFCWDWANNKHITLRRVITTRLLDLNSRTFPFMSSCHSVSLPLTIHCVVYCRERLFCPFVSCLSWLFLFVFVPLFSFHVKLLYWM
jgi:hypothetical protein